jgi:hypothetical protein
MHKQLVQTEMYTLYSVAHIKKDIVGAMIFFLKDPANAGFSLISIGKTVHMSPGCNCIWNQAEKRKKINKVTMATIPSTLVALVRQPRIGR